MASVQWIALFVQMIYLPNVNGGCNIFQTNHYRYITDKYYGTRQVHFHELECKHVEINALRFAEYNNQNLIGIINITESNTTQIYPGTFHSMYYLERVYVTHSDISEITKGLFIGYFLTILDISTNNISKIEPNSFSGLSSLEMLNISGNNLQNINFFGHDFKYNITNLDLSHNKISSIADKFAVLTKLLTLNLSDNLINNFDDDPFSNLNWLESLNLAENQIMQIPMGTFKDMHSLTFLNLSNNKIISMSLGTFAGLSSLNTIDLSFNKIKSFSEDILHDMHNVNTFYINNNFISDLNVGAFLGHLPVLEYVSLARNNWTCGKLSEIIRSLRSKKITLRLGGSFRERNINGIACSGESYNEGIKQTTDINDNQSIEVGLEKLKRYFANDFKQSEFYQFFNNKFPKDFEDSFKDANLFKQIDDDFVNSKFYKYFAEGYINSTFFEYLDKKIETMKTLHSMDNTPYKKSDYKELLQNVISEYFDSLKPSNDYLREYVDAEEKDNTMMKTQNKLMIVLIFVMVLIWITMLCKYRKVNETKKRVVNFLMLRQSRKEVQNVEDQLL